MLVYRSMYNGACPLRYSTKSYVALLHHGVVRETKGSTAVAKMMNGTIHIDAFALSMRVLYSPIILNPTRGTINVPVAYLVLVLDTCCRDLSFSPGHGSSLGTTDTTASVLQRRSPRTWQ